MIRSRLARLTLAPLGLDSVAGQVRALKRGREPADARTACAPLGVEPAAPGAFSDLSGSANAHKVFELEHLLGRTGVRFGGKCSGFDNCVAGLQSAMFSADNPEN